MDVDVALIDPQGKYPACGLRRVDRLAIHVLWLVPDARLDRTRDAYEIACGGGRLMVRSVVPNLATFRRLP